MCAVTLPGGFRDPDDAGAAEYPAIRARNPAPHVATIKDSRLREFILRFILDSISFLALEGCRRWSRHGSIGRFGQARTCNLQAASIFRHLVFRQHDYQAVGGLLPLDLPVVSQQRALFDAVDVLTGRLAQRPDRDAPIGENLRRSHGWRSAGRSLCEHSNARYWRFSAVGVARSSLCWRPPRESP
jgi:hypothetical protein